MTITTTNESSFLSILNEAKRAHCELLCKGFNKEESCLKDYAIEIMTMNGTHKKRKKILAYKFLVKAFLTPQYIEVEISAVKGIYENEVPVDRPSKFTDSIFFVEEALWRTFKMLQLDKLNEPFNFKFEMFINDILPKYASKDYNGALKTIGFEIDRKGDTFDPETFFIERLYTFYVDSEEEKEEYDDDTDNTDEGVKTVDDDCYDCNGCPGCQ